MFWCLTTNYHTLHMRMPLGVIYIMTTTWNLFFRSRKEMVDKTEQSWSVKNIEEVGREVGLYKTLICMLIS